MSPFISDPTPGSHQFPVRFVRLMETTRLNRRKFSLHLTPIYQRILRKSNSCARYTSASDYASIHGESLPARTRGSHLTSEPRDANATIRAGIDIGGTFTDILVYDNSTGEFTVGKTLTTTDDPSRGATDGIRETIGETGNSIAALAQIVHGTTLITNALIERKGAKTALITTKGFRDALEIAREHRYDIYDLLLELPDPLVPRHLRFEVDERVLSDGSIDTPLDSASVAEVIAQLENAAVESVAISLLHSYTNPEHEQQIERLVHEALPDLVLSSSSSVDPEIREFERTSTTVANVYVRPIAKQYLERFLERLDDEDFSGNLLIMLSSGGVCTPQTAQEVPIRLVESGPAAGALAAAHIGSRSGRPSLFRSTWAERRPRPV